MANNFGAAAANANFELNSTFMLEIDGVALMAFEKITTTPQEYGIIEGRTGADGLTKHTSSGLKKPVVITIEKSLRSGGIQDIRDIVNWSLAGSKDKRSGSIVFLDRDSQELARFNFADGWVSKFKLPDLDASADAAPATFQFDISTPDLTMA